MYSLSYVSTTHTHLSSKTITKLHVKYDIRLDNYTMYRDFKVTLRFGTKYQCKKKKTIQMHLSLSWFQENNKDCALTKYFTQGTNFFFNN